MKKQENKLVKDNYLLRDYFLKL